MPVPVTWAGTTYNVPLYNDTGYAQNSGNLSLYLVSLAQNAIGTSGGTYALSSTLGFSGFDLAVTTVGKGVIVPDTTNGHTYRLVTVNGAVTAVLVT